MADSTVTDVNKMKVVELRKELKSRGLSYAGDKAELVSRLQAALTQDEHNDINFEFDEMDSDGVFEDEEAKIQTDVLDDSAVDALNEDLVLAEQPSVTTPPVGTKPPRILKRKITTETKDKSMEKDASAKKIVLNRATTSSLVSTNQTEDHPEEKSESVEEKCASESNVIKINTDLDPKKRLELRAKRFGLPIKMSDTERKEARKQRFNQNSNSNSFSSTGTLNENIDKLKKRAERFGESVSKIMTDIELKEKLEKRKAKFGTVA